MELLGFCAQGEVGKGFCPVKNKGCKVVAQSCREPVQIEGQVRGI